LSTALMVAFQPKLLQYQKYRLTANPFAGAVPRSEVSFLVPRGDELEKAFWTIQSVLSGASTHSIIIGGYGNGKTHTLRYIQSVIQEERPDILSVYVGSPGETFRQLYSAILTALGHEFVTDVVWKYLATVATKNSGSLKVSKEDAERLRSKPLMIKQYVKQGKLLLTELVQLAKEELMPKVRLLDIVTALLHLIFDDFAFLSWKWLIAEDVPYEQRRDLGLTMSINNDDRALRAFLSIRQILLECGYKAIVLLVDEFELVSTLPERSRQRILNEIRHLIDQTPNEFSIFLACAPEAWKMIVEHYHAFLDRFTHYAFLKPLDDKQTLGLIKAYLDRARVGKNGDTTYPFDREFVHVIQELSMGNVRTTLKLCQIALDYGLMKGLDRVTGSVRPYLENVLKGRAEDGSHKSAR
jgi:hypothetical protein